MATEVVRLPSFVAVRLSVHGTCVIRRIAATAVAIEGIADNRPSGA